MLRREQENAHRQVLATKAACYSGSSAYEWE